MARDAHDREDLLREATGLVERVEFVATGMATGDPIVCGFRPQGELSIFWGQDDVAQFNRHDEFRRGYQHGRMIGAYQRNLFWLVKEQSGGRAHLRRDPFTPTEREQFVGDLEQKLAQLQSMLDSDGQYTVIGEVPDGANVLGRVAAWLKQRKPVQLARYPGVGRAASPTGDGDR